MIELQKLCKRYGNATAVNGLDLRFESGEITVLLGPSGCGKTTTLRMINRLIEPSGGTVLIDGQDYRTLPPQQLRRRMGYVIQQVGLFPHLSVADNIATVPRLLGWNARRITSRVDELLELVGLPPGDFRHKRPHELSGGQAQRIGVARALAADPPILLMDEPFGAIDPLARERLQDEFLNIQRRLRKTVVLVTHDIDEALRLGDRLALMRAGRLEQFARTDEVLARPANDFVRSFIGTDHALKRLTRLPVTRRMQPATAISEDHPRPLEALGEARWAFVTAPDGTLLGWVDRRDLEAQPRLALALRPLSEDECVLEEASAKEALSRMLALGTANLAVVDAQRRLLGQVNVATLGEA
ncbi:osmoprotectant transport system ATP-binding protein [Deinobacterium chartae]|uniref:Osmoprotectant transport system ATP-binding protein n=1 Tax=Deinobacterium chartae TaxID=521158 RepID=A0A841HYB5_9DEIO|nr:ABC transporter ATP-binding protein [Deinobacterium chartae]MBB6096928.1 osmoprotectant transport system ATP-binding protein [Deinobacterium chartae]